MTNIAMPPRKIAILQSNYIPWKGYFDLIGIVDEFVIYDEVQYTRQDWRNRNLIKTPRGIEWLTIPVGTKNIYETPIKDKKVSDTRWKKKHFATIVQNYSKSTYFVKYKSWLEHLYLDYEYTYLSEVNYHFIKNICHELGITTKISWSTDYALTSGKTTRLVEICSQAKGNVYVSGPAAKVYLEESLFRQHSIAVEWMDYSGYPEYNQLFPPFVHGVSILDLILNEGPEARRFLKG